MVYEIFCGQYGRDRLFNDPAFFSAFTIRTTQPTTDQNHNDLDFRL
jgi:hypothetical protein